MTHPDLDDRDSQPTYQPPDHPTGCDNGWLPAVDPDHPRPCPTCRPWLTGPRTHYGAPTPRKAKT